MGFNRFVQLTGRLVVTSRNHIPLILGDMVDQRKSFSTVFAFAPYVPRLDGRGSKGVESHGEIVIDRGSALKQRNSSQEMSLFHLGPTRREVLESLERTRSRLLERQIPLLDRVVRFSQLAAHGRGRASHCVQHVLFIDCLALLPAA